MLPADVPALLGAAPGPARVVLLPFRDNQLGFRRLMGALIDRSHARALVHTERGRTALGDVQSLHHHAVFDGSRLAGIWEYEPMEKRVVWGAFGPLAPSRRAAIDRAAAATEAFIREELGDLLFYAVDNEKNRTERLAVVRALGAGSA